MRKFGVVYKEKRKKSSDLHEAHVIRDFKKIYNSLLERYGLTNINDLNERSQVSFLTEVNKYWSEETGLNDLGKKFLQKKSMMLTENSTSLQKKNYLKTKTTTLLNELMRQTDFKYKVYSIIDEMYQQTGSSKVTDIMPANTIADVISEGLASSLDKMVNNIHHEISESAKPNRRKK